MKTQKLIESYVLGEGKVSCSICGSSKPIADAHGTEYAVCGDCSKRMDAVKGDWSYAWRVVKRRHDMGKNES